MGKLFGTDGMRGTAGMWPMTPEFVLRLGQAAGEILRQGRPRLSVVAGRDTRQSGPLLQQALTAGLLAAGVDVIDAGVIPTPGVAWLVRRLGAEAGCVISASHNPVDQNGIKFFNAGGQKLPEALEDQIEQRIGVTPEAEVAPFAMPHRLGRVSGGAGLQEVYVQGLITELPDLNLSGLKIVLDCANGAAAFVAPEVLTRLGATLFVTHASPNGFNINNGCGSEHIRRWPGDMAALIRSAGADFGIAFDGDADRVIFMDERGEVVDGDHMLGFMARDLQARGELMGGAVVTTHMANAGLREYIENLGLEMHLTPVGDKYVTEKLLALRKDGAGGYGLGGEQSGHIVLMDEQHATGDGLRSALFVIHAFQQAGAASLAEFAAGVGKTPQIIASAHVGRGPRLERGVLEALEAETLRRHPGLARLNLRYSGTEPLFRAMLESDGRQSVSDLAQIATDLCRQVQRHAGLEHAEIDILNTTTGGVIAVE